MKKIIALIAVVAVLFSGVLGFVVIKSDIKWDDAQTLKELKFKCNILRNSRSCTVLRNRDPKNYNWKIKINTDF